MSTNTLIDTVAPLDTTNHPAKIVKTAQEDVVSWYDILTHETVIDQGVLSKDAQRGSTLFSRVLSPSTLQSKYHKSIIKHLSEMFAHWHGTIVLKLVTTLPYFVSTKIVFAYSPTGPNLDNLSPGALAGLQNSVILNPTTANQVILPVPFVVTGNWAPVSGSSGRVIAKLLEPLVFSMDFTGGLPWTLLVSADPNDFAFRYIIPPPAEDDGADSGTSSPTTGPTLSDRTLARSMSTRSGAPRTRNVPDWPLVQQPVAAPSIRYESMLLVPRSRVEYVMQKVRGQFPSVEGATNFVADMFDIPAFTYSSYSPLSLPHPSSLYPYLSQTFLLWSSGTGWYPQPAVASPCQWRVVSDAILLWLQVPETAYGVLDNLTPTLYFQAISHSKPVLATADKFDYLFVEKHQSSDGRYWHGFKRAPDTAVAPALGMTLMRCAMTAWSGVRGRAEYICDLLRQIDDCPPEVTHLALYTTMPPELAGAFNSWLTTSDNQSPPAKALCYSIAFSPNQSALAFNGGRFDGERNTKGVVWRLFKLFKGDETKWWAWLVKGLDVVVDALIGAFLGRATVSYIVPIGEGSGFRVEAVGDYDKTAITQYDGGLALEHIPQTPSLTLLEAFTEFPAPSLSTRRFKKHSSKSHPATPQPSAPSTPSPMVSRSASRVHRARHPSSKKRFFLRN